MTTGVKVGLGLAAALGTYLAFRKGKDGLNSIQRLLGSSPSIPREALTVEEVRTVDSRFNSANGKKTLITAESRGGILARKGSTSGYITNNPQKCPTGSHNVKNTDGSYSCVPDAV